MNNVFDNAFSLIEKTAGLLELEKRHPGMQILERIRIPDRVIMFRATGSIPG